MLTTPIINSFKPFNALLSYDFIFNVFGGDQVVSNKLTIEKASDGTIVYNTKIDNFQFKHTVPSNTLINGIQYRVKVKTYNNLGQESQYSDSVIFYCFSDSIINVPISDNLVKNSSFEFVGNYFQNENEQVQSYRFYLYDENQVLLTSSKEIFSTDFRYTFDNLQDNGHYFIELKVYTVHGMIATSTLIPFDVDYFKPLFNTSVVLEDIPSQASVKINAHILNIEGNIGSGTISYENSDWLDVRNGTVYFDEQHGFTLNDNWTMKIWCKNLTEDMEIMTLYDINGVKIKLVFYSNKIHCFKEINGINLSHYASNMINYIDNSVVFIFLQNEEDRIYLQSEII